MTSSNGNIFRVTGHCAGNSPVSGEFPAQRPVTRSFDVSLICAWINGWVNNREAGDLRRHRAHYVFRVMFSVIVIMMLIDRNVVTWGIIRYSHWMHWRLWNPILFLSWQFLEHDDVIKWKHFPHYWPFVRGIHRSPVNSPHKGQWRGALMFSLMCA